MAIKNEPVIKGPELDKIKTTIGPGWEVVKGHHLKKEWKFPDFKEALAFTNKVGELSESINHHPDIYLRWGLVKLTLWSHSGNGITASDVDLAAKIDELK